MSQRPAEHQRGVSLLEVMIAVLVLAVGVLGAATLQLNAIRYNASAGYSTQASLIASDLLDRMRANSGQLDQYAIAAVAGECVASPDAPTLASPNGATATITARDLADFSESVTCRLPRGTGSIAVSDNRATITLSWSEARTRAAEDDSRFITSSVVR
ncbi:MAG: type IV pilus modification protein PilV [Halopseudomonas sp.]